MDPFGPMVRVQEFVCLFGRWSVVPPHASPPAPSLLRELAPGPASEPTVAESSQAGWCLGAGVRVVYGCGSS